MAMTLQSSLVNTQPDHFSQRICHQPLNLHVLSPRACGTCLQRKEQHQPGCGHATSFDQRKTKKKKGLVIFSAGVHTHIHTHTHTHTHTSFTSLSPWKYSSWTSLVVQCLRSFLSMQGTWVQVLVREDSACCRSSKPVHCKYWSPSTLDPMMCNKRSHCNEKPVHHSSGVAPACWN